MTAKKAILWLALFILLAALAWLGVSAARTASAARLALTDLDRLQALGGDDPSPADAPHGPRRPGRTGDASDHRSIRGPALPVAGAEAGMGPALRTDPGRGAGAARHGRGTGRRRAGGAGRTRAADQQAGRGSGPRSPGRSAAGHFGRGAAVAGRRRPAGSGPGAARGHRGRPASPAGRAVAAAGSPSAAGARGPAGRPGRAGAFGRRWSAHLSDPGAEQPRAARHRRFHQRRGIRPPRWGPDRRSETERRLQCGRPDAAAPRAAAGADRADGDPTPDLARQQLVARLP